MIKMKERKLVFIALLILVFTTTRTVLAQPSIPAGYQSFYVLGNCSMIVEEAVDEAFGYDPDEAIPVSIFSVVSSQDKTRIYVDQKSNGYTFNPADFTGADAVIELDRGGVITFNNTQAPYYEIVPVGSGQNISGTILAPGIDGGDYFFVAGGPLSVFRGVTDARTEFGDGNYVAGMWELFSVEEGGDDAQKVYEVPCGEDTLNTADFDGPPEGNGGTFIVVQSTEDDTQVNYTQKGVPGQQTLGRGDSFVIPHVNQGDTIASHKKIQVGLIASGGQTFDIRYFTLKDVRFTGRDYWIPLYPVGSTPINVKYHIHALTDANVTIETQAGIVPGWNNKAMLEGTTDATYVTNGTYPVRILADPDQKLIVLVSVDTGSGNRDWGYVPIDSTALSSEYFVPHAPSGRTSNTDMQLYVSSIIGGATIFADYDQDGLADEFVTLNLYESHGFYDSDLDNTGTHLFSDFPFTVVYGQSSTAPIAGPSTAGYDWGYTIIPLGLEEPDIVLNLEKTVSPSTVSGGHNVTFTLNITSGDNDFVLQFHGVNDTLPDGFVYLNDTTTIRHANDTLSYGDPFVNGTFLNWDFNETLNANDYITVTFMANSSIVPKSDYINIAVATAEDPFGNIYTPEGKAFIDVVPNCIVRGYIYNVTCGGQIGVPDITVELYNTTAPGPPIFVNATTTDHLGHYMFCNITAGTYNVLYNYLDPDLGLLIPHSDDDPLVPVKAPWTRSDNFTVAFTETHYHDFEVILPVDIFIIKTGVETAQVGEEIQYFFEVGNNGFTAAKNVTVTDDICGTPDYIQGDTNFDDRLDPDETWLYACDYIVNTSDPNPLVNIVNVTTTSHELDPNDNNDTWSVRIINTGLIVDKTRITPVNMTAYVNEPVIFNTTITNTGNAPLELVPFTDTYDPTKLDYINANPAPDTVNEITGTLNWVDLTVPGVLAPNGTLHVVTTFTAIASTSPNTTINYVEVIDAKVEEQEIYVSDNDTAPVLILEPLIMVNKTCTSHPSGTVVEGHNVTFTIVFVNNGDTPIQALPFTDSYDPIHLAYLEATPVPDSINETIGELEWNDLTYGTDIDPGENTTVVIIFQAIEWTTDKTKNNASVINVYFGDEVYLNATDSDEIRIIPLVGGTVYANPLYRIAQLASTLILIVGLALAGRRFGLPIASPYGTP